MSKPIHPAPFPIWEENYAFLTSPAFKGLPEATQYQIVCRVMAQYLGQFPRSAEDQDHLNWLRKVRTCYELLGHPKWRPGLKQGILTASAAARRGYPELAGQVVEYEDVWHPGQLAKASVLCAPVYWWHAGAWKRGHSSAIGASVAKRQMHQPEEERN